MQFLVMAGWLFLNAIIVNGAKHQDDKEKAQQDYKLFVAKQKHYTLGDR